jgi:hypothetical protein
MLVADISPVAGSPMFGYVVVCPACGEMLSLWNTMPGSAVWISTERVDEENRLLMPSTVYGFVCAECYSDSIWPTPPKNLRLADAALVQSARDALRSGWGKDNKGNNTLEKYGWKPVHIMGRGVRPSGAVFGAGEPIASGISMEMVFAGAPEFGVPYSRRTAEEAVKRLKGATNGAGWDPNGWVPVVIMDRKKKVPRVWGLADKVTGVLRASCPVEKGFIPFNDYVSVMA